MAEMYIHWNGLRTTSEKLRTYGTSLLQRSETCRGTTAAIAIRSDSILQVVQNLQTASAEMQRIGTELQHYADTGLSLAGIFETAEKQAVQSLMQLPPIPEISSPGGTEPADSAPDFEVLLRSVTGQAGMLGSGFSAGMYLLSQGSMADPILLSRYTVEIVGRSQTVNWAEIESVSDGILELTGLRETAASQSSSCPWIGIAFTGALRGREGYRNWERGDLTLMEAVEQSLLHTSSDMLVGSTAAAASAAILGAGVPVLLAGAASVSAVWLLDSAVRWGTAGASGSFSDLLTDLALQILD